MYTVFCVIDYRGGCVLGKVSDSAISEDGNVPPVVHMTDPISMREFQSRENPEQVHLSFSAYMQTFDVTYVTIKWTTAFKANERMIAVYEDHVVKLRAARAGISLVGPSQAPS